MARRSKSKHYSIKLPGGRHRIPAVWWWDYVRRGLFVVSSAGERVARLRDGVDGWLENGYLRLRDTLTQIEVSIPSSWRLVDRAAIYDPRCLARDQIPREVAAQYCLPGLAV